MVKILVMIYITTGIPPNPNTGAVSCAHTIVGGFKGGIGPTVEK